MEDPQVYLLDYLREEFARFPEIRVRVAPVAQEPGILVRSESREYFFPQEWVTERRFDQIQALIEHIKAALPDR